MITKKASSNPILAWIQNEDNMNVPLVTFMFSNPMNTPKLDA